MLAEEIVVGDLEAEYAEDTWDFLHESELNEDSVLGLRAYLDDSGSDDNSKIVTIGGPVFSRIQFKAFSKKWAILLHKYRIAQPFHMVDFVRPNGEHIGIGREMKLSIFRDVAALINSHKLYSLSVAISQKDFKDRLPDAVRKVLIGPYAMAFFTAVSFVTELSKKKPVGSAIAYLVDDGCAHKDQLVAAHSAIMNIEKGRPDQDFLHTGRMGFDIDDRVPALQAADVIAWSSRRRDLGTLKDEFEPLNEILQDKKAPTHGHVPMPIHGIEMLANPINLWISRKGSMPSLGDIIRP